MALRVVAPITVNICTGRGSGVDVEHWLIFALDINKQMSQGRREQAEGSREQGILLSLPLARANTLSLMNAYTNVMCECVRVGGQGKGSLLLC